MTHQLLEARRAVLSALHGEIRDGFNASRVQIMSPHFEAQPDEPVPATSGGGET